MNAGAFSGFFVSFNGIRFDYEVLRTYGLRPELIYPKSYDILVEIKKALGHRVTLDSVAMATLGVEKSSSGIEAVKWFREGKIKKVVDYCHDDTKITKRIYEFIQYHGFCYYTGLRGEILKCNLKK